MEEQWDQCLLDGRYLTSFLPNTDVENLNRASFNCKNNTEYRKYLQENAVDIMKENRDKLDQLYGCGPYENTMLAEETIKICDKNSCRIEKVKGYDNEKGLGQGRFFTNNKECIYKLKKRQ